MIKRRIIRKYLESRYIELYISFIRYEGLVVILFTRDSTLFISRSKDYQIHRDERNKYRHTTRRKTELIRPCNRNINKCERNGLTGEGGGKLILEII